MNSAAAYRERIGRPDWREVVCPRILRRAGGRCERCRKRRPLEVHHLTYERLGCERDEDLLVLCPPCHRAADKEREEREALRRRAREANEDEAREDAWFDGWLIARGYDPRDVGQDVDVLRREFYEDREGQ